MALNDYEYEYRGFVFGPPPHAVGVIEATGLTDLIAEVGDTPIPRGSGDVPGLVVAGPKYVTLAMRAKGEKRSQALADALSEAREAFAMTQTPEALKFKEPGVPERLIYARTIGFAVLRNPTTTHGFQPFAVQLKASDPRVYSAEEYGTNLSIYDASGGGTDYPEDYGIDFLGATSTNERVLTNDGNANAYPKLRFYGPTTGTLTGVTVTNITTGQTLVINSTILSGQILTADMGRLVTLDPTDVPYINLDGSNRYGDWQLPRDPFYLAPGDNTLRFEVTGTTTDALCVINHRDTWL